MRESEKKRETKYEKEKNKKKIKSLQTPQAHSIQHWSVNRLGNNQNNRSINRIIRKFPTPIINAMNG